MKKFFLLLIAIFCCIQITFAQDKDYSLSFNGTKYYLLYSAKDKDYGGYINEYYKHGETYNIWSELVAVHHFPNAYSPIDRIKEFKDYLGSMNVPSSLTFDDKKNTAMIDFIIITGKKDPVILEFNIFKYEKSKKCGSIAIQYAKRYSAYTTMQIEEIKKDFEKNRKTLIKKVKNFEIPKVISEDIDKCISSSEVVKGNSNNVIHDKEITENKTLENGVPNKENENNDTKIIKAADSEIVINTDNKSENSKVDEPIENEQDNTVVNEKENADIESNKTDTDLLKAESSKTQVVIEQNIEQKNEENIDTSKNDNEKEAVTLNKTKEIKTEDEKVIAVEKRKNSREKKGEIILISNDKEDFYAKSRTNKDLKNEIKQKKLKQKEQQKQDKIKAKNDKKLAKEEAKKQKKDLKEKIKIKKMDEKIEKRDAKWTAKQDKINKKQQEKFEKMQLKYEKKDMIKNAREEKRLQKINAKNQKEIDKLNKKKDEIEELIRSKKEKSNAI